MEAEDQLGIELSRYRAIIGSCWLAWVFYTVLHYSNGHPVAGAIHGVAATLVTLLLASSYVSPTLLRLKVLAHLNILVTLITLALNSWDGALLNDSLWFLALVPLFAAYQLGQRAALVWAGITVSTVLFLSVMAVRLGPSAEWVPGPAERGRNRAVLVLLVAVFGVAGSRATEAQLQRAQQNERLYREASAAKSEFLAGMSHELRTPLNAIQGFTQMLEDEMVGPLNEKQQRYVNNVSDASRHLLNLVNDVLDLTRIEEHRFQLELESVKPAILIQRAVDELVPLARDKSLDYRSRIEELETGRLDPRRFHQILVNLIGNAIKFTPEGGSVEVLARKENDQLHLEVRDSGIGLKAEELEAIFERFHQGDSGLDRKYRGCGLGLALTRELVRLHRGRVWAESEGPGKGAVLQVVIPLPGADS